MHSTTIKIDGAKLRELLENRTNKTIYQIATESGYSKNVISNAIKKGYASSAVQNIARLYDITPDLYEIKKEYPVESEELKGQLSIDDIETIKRSELKDLIKEAILELVNNSEIIADYNPKNKHVYIMAREEAE